MQTGDIFRNARCQAIGAFVNGDSVELSVRIFGELTVAVNGEAVALPPSKKTRALLAYLIVTARDQRRGRLCSLLWDVADDPRGALRWSLSRIRKVVGRERVVSARDTVRFVAAGADIDLHALRSIAVDPASTPTDELERRLSEISGELLEGLQLPDFDEFESWCVAQREDARRLHVRLLRTMATRLVDAPERALPHLQMLVRLEPLNEDARMDLFTALGRAGRADELEQAHRSMKRLYAELGVRPSPALEATVGAVSHAGPRTARIPERPAQEVPGNQLVGRGPELARIEAAVTAVTDTAQLRGILLLGEPGAGKSRLLDELPAFVRARGGTVLAGAAFEAEQDRPYGPFVDVLREVGAPRLEVLLGEDDERSQTRLFERVSESVDALVQGRSPLVLVLDDLHWIDEASATLLHYIARTHRARPVLVALAARAGELHDNDAAMRLLRGLRREGPLEEVAVGPLDSEAVAHFLANVAPECDPALVYARSGGNPLYVAELARTGCPEEPSSSLVQLVRTRLDALPESARSVLSWGSVLGATFRVARLAALSLLEANDLTTALETLERHALLRQGARADDPMGGYSFAHDVVHRAVYHELSTPRRRLMHRQVARMLADEAPAAEVAHHAALAGDAALAARSCVDAARHSLSLFAPREAHGLARRGLRYAEQLPEPARTLRQIELAEVVYRSRMPETPDDAAEEMETLAKRALALGETAHARMGFEVVAYIRWEDGDWPEAERTVLTTEHLTRGVDDVARIDALAEAARCLLMIDRDHQRAEVFNLEAQALAERMGIDSVSVWAAAGMLNEHRGELENAASAFARARGMARHAKDRLAEYLVLERQVLVALERGRLADARRLAAELVILGDRLREGSERPHAHALVALVRLVMATPVVESHLVELEMALDALREADANHRLAAVLNHAAMWAVDHERPALARHWAAGALEAARRVGHRSQRSLAHAVLLSACRALGDQAAADAERHILADEPLAGVARTVRARIEACLTSPGSHPCPT